MFKPQNHPLCACPVRSDMRASFQFQIDAQESGLQPPVAYKWSEAGGWQRVAARGAEEAAARPQAPAAVAG